jgi:HlyD family secretion protein
MCQSIQSRLVSVLLSLCLTACSRPEDPGLQGYVEGEYVRVASALAGRLQALQVSRGQRVESKRELFVLEHARELASLQAAEGDLERSKALLNDLEKGQRPSEIAAVEAQLDQARAAVKLSSVQLERQQRLSKQQFVARELLDELHSALERDKARVVELQARLATARLGGRADAIAAAAAAVEAAHAAVDQARWSVEQKAVNAPAAGTVTDYFYRPGEWVPAGSPVVEILPPSNVKVRIFVPESQLGAVRYEQRVRIGCDGCATGLWGQVAFISPTAEYTPPVIYSLSTRQKLVYMVELGVPPDVGAQLHPGQPVSVYLR